jgi:hypothetical protein
MQEHGQEEPKLSSQQRRALGMVEHLVKTNRHKEWTFASLYRSLVGVTLEQVAAMQLPEHYTRSPNIATRAVSRLVQSGMDFFPESFEDIKRRNLKERRRVVRETGREPWKAINKDIEPIEDEVEQFLREPWYVTKQRLDEFLDANPHLFPDAFDAVDLPDPFEDD